MEDSSSDFEKKFIQQINNNQPPAQEEKQHAPAKKSTINKKVIAAIIGFAAVLMAIVLIPIIIKSSPNEPDEPSIIGLWTCTDGVEFNFQKDGTYQFLDKTNGDISEGGTFTQENEKLSILPQPTQQDSPTDVWVIFQLTFKGNDKIQLYDEEDGADYECTRQNKRGKQQ